MATKPLSEMGGWELKKARDLYLGQVTIFNNVGAVRGDYAMYLILANQYDTELTRREKENGE